MPEPSGHHAGPVVIVGDVGSTAAFHVGDEAMLEALVRDAAGGADWIVVSADPAATTAALALPAVSRLGFPAGRDPAHGAAREARLAEILAFDAAGGAPPDDPAHHVLAALDLARGLVIAGGGNLSSSWPEHVWERAALTTLARRRGLPVVVSGQTLGPRLVGRERELAGAALRAADLVGVREADSRLLALDLGVQLERIALQLDDAMFLAGDGRGAVPAGDRPTIAVTVCDLGREHVRATRLDGLAAELADVAARTGAALRLIPHTGDLAGAPVEDVRVAEDLELRLRERGAPVSTASLAGAAATARATRAAALVIATRYHPLVFGLGAGVPSLAVYVDDYTRTKMQGALAFAGLEAWSLHVDTAVGGRLADAALELWARRPEVRGHLEALRPGWHAAHDVHVARVTTALAGEAPSGTPDAPGLRPPAGAPRPAGAWVAPARRADRLRHAEEAEGEELVTRLTGSFREAERYALSLRAALDEADAETAAPRARRGRRRRDSGDRPAAPPQGLVLRDLRHEERDGDALASMQVGLDGRDLGRLVLRRHGAALDDIDRTATPFVAMAAVLATTQGRDVAIDGPVDELARANAERAGEVIGGWFGWRPARIDAAETLTGRAPADRRGQFLSRGLDSMATYARHSEHLDALVSMDWRDPPYATDGTAALWRGTRAAALDAGLPLIAVSTNARSILDPFTPWDFSHGCVLGSLGQLVSPSLGEVLIAGGFPPGREAPAGTHPELDPLWSSSSQRLVYDSGGGGRNEKAALVADVPFCVRHLKVCWERPGDGNCGRCCKCVLTMTNFHVSGGLDSVAHRFEAPLTPAAVEWVARHGSPTTPMNATLVIERLAPNDPLLEPWTRMLERARAQDPASLREQAAGAA